jgi:hypothetical protein
VIARTYRCDPTTIMRIRWREQREGVVHHLPVPAIHSRPHKPVARRDDRAGGGG